MEYSSFCADCVRLSSTQVGVESWFSPLHLASKTSAEVYPNMLCPPSNLYLRSLLRLSRNVKT